MKDRRIFPMIRLLMLLASSVGPLIAASQALADKPQVLAVDISCTPERVCSFEVTLKHADSGWDHYANRWEVRSPSGDVLGTRVLAHPHVDEQPFTRDLDGVRLPPDLKEVHVYANDSVHGISQDPFVVKVP